MTYEEIGRELGLSRSCIAAIEKAALAKLRRRYPGCLHMLQDLADELQSRDRNGPDFYDCDECGEEEELQAA